MKGYLLLEDGTKLCGEIVGAKQSTVGEVVFNTGMTGYQEVLTDPSYYGQIVMMTYPMIGNYGINKDDAQSHEPKVKGFIIRECNEFHSNWRSEKSLGQYLEEHGITAIHGIDTRYLTKHIREVGTMSGKIIVENDEAENNGAGTHMDEIEAFTNDNPALKVSTKHPYMMGTGKYKVAVLDFGIKQNILDSLIHEDTTLQVFPAETSAEEIMKYEPDGIFLSNGPGDPDALTGIIETVKGLIGKKPMFGICLGHQLITLALGGKTEKMKYGHRGSNHPVRDFNLNRVFITSQNHGYVVVEESIKDLDIEVTHRNSNDNSIEGIKHLEYPLFSVQYHPEACPGPNDSKYLFEQFMTLMTKGTN